MADVKHTPGPWRVVPYDAGDVSWWSGTPSIQAPDDLDCAIVHWAGFAQQYWRSARGDAEIRANARLIASAPELLAALKELHLKTVVGTDEERHAALNQAWAAISKAEGK